MLRSLSTAILCISTSKIKVKSSMSHSSDVFLTIFIAASKHGSSNNSH